MVPLPLFCFLSVRCRRSSSAPFGGTFPPGEGRALARRCVDTVLRIGMKVVGGAVSIMDLLRGAPPSPTGDVL